MTLNDLATPITLSHIGSFWYQQLEFNYLTTTWIPFKTNKIKCPPQNNVNFIWNKQFKRKLRGWLHMEHSVDIYIYIYIYICLHIYIYICVTCTCNVPLRFLWLARFLWSPKSPNSSPRGMWFVIVDWLTIFQHYLKIHRFAVFWLDNQLRILPFNHRISHTRLFIHRRNVVSNSEQNVCSDVVFQRVARKTRVI